MRLPSGTVTFLFTDIEGSTALWERDREAMASALARHNAILSTAIEAHGGHVFKTVGDAFCAAFARAFDAVEAAVAAQRKLLEEDWSQLGEAGPLRVRMGVHTGEANERGGDYFGPPVNRVARLEAAGHGGQLLVSLVTQRLVRDRLPEGCRLRDRGEHRLEDLLHSEHIFQVEGEGMPEIDARLRTAQALHPRDQVHVIDRSHEADGATKVIRAPDDSKPPEDVGLAGLWTRLEKAIAVDRGPVLALTPAEASELAQHKPADWREWRLGRIAEWSQARYRLDGRFVGLTLLLDQGEDAAAGRWRAKSERYGDLAELLADVSDPALVILGPPGCGKSTLLRRLELDTALAGLGEVDEERRRVTFFVAMGTYKEIRPGDPPPAPAEWLAERWAARAPELPALDTLLAEGRVTLLLDAINEIPAADPADYRARLRLWKDWLLRLSVDQPDNRVIFSCRSLDYSQPLSTPELRVPQVRIEPLSNGQVREFLALYSPARWREIWAALDNSPQLEVLRSPYFLSLLVEHVEATGDLPMGRAALFTGFVRQALRREIERGNVLFDPGLLLSPRDLRRVTGWTWSTPYDLPERGPLLPKLAALAHAMQDSRAAVDRSQVRIAIDEALRLLDDPNDEAILAAGAALAVLDEDQAVEEIRYVHQLLQEYFAARVLAKSPQPELVQLAWRATEIFPGVEEVIDALEPSEPLPGLPQTGWEETTLLAAAMQREPEDFVRGVMETNLALAGRAAMLPEVLPTLPSDLLDSLRWALVERSRDPAADLRVRIACGYAVGVLGDPRFEERSGPHGSYLLPPFIEVSGGTYAIGGDDPITWSVMGASGATVAHVPRHEVELDAFRIGQFLVTNAEWSHFMAAGGYEEEQWWKTEDARRWRRGELANEGAKLNNRLWRRRFLSEPGLLERMAEDGRFASTEAVVRWRAWMALDEEAFAAALDQRWKATSNAEPAFWRNDHYNHPAQPVIGVCWYEARAYNAWLSAQTGLAVRLPTEVAWEAAAGGAAGRRFPWGEELAPAIANTFESRVKRTSPVGVFVDGDSPSGITDLGGNVFEWTMSLFGEIDEDDLEAPAYPYPYAADDGREDPTAPPTVRRVVRGGGWDFDRALARAAARDSHLPGDRSANRGLRLMVEDPGPSRDAHHGRDASI